MKKLILAINIIIILSLLFGCIKFNDDKPEGLFFIIHKDLEYTTTPEVVLDLSGIKNASKMRFSNDQTELEDSEWVDYSAEFNWDLGSFSEDTYTVYGEFKSSVENTYENQVRLTSFATFFGVA